MWFRIHGSFEYRSRCILEQMVATPLLANLIGKQKCKLDKRFDQRWIIGSRGEISSPFSRRISRSIFQQRLVCPAIRDSTLEICVSTSFAIHRDFVDGKSMGGEGWGEENGAFASIIEPLAVEQCGKSPDLFSNSPKISFREREIGTPTRNIRISDRRERFKVTLGEERLSRSLEPVCDMYIKVAECFLRRCVKNSEHSSIFVTERTSWHGVVRKKNIIILQLEWNIMYKNIIIGILIF